MGQFSDGTPAPNEVVVGEALKPIREKVILATKFGNFWDENHQLYQDGSPASIRKSIEVIGEFPMRPMITSAGQMQCVR